MANTNIKIQLDGTAASAKFDGATVTIGASNLIEMSAPIGNHSLEVTYQDGKVKTYPMVVPKSNEDKVAERIAEGGLLTPEAAEQNTAEAVELAVELALENSQGYVDISTITEEDMIVTLDTTKTPTASYIKLYYGSGTANMKVSDLSSSITVKREYMYNSFFNEPNTSGAFFGDAPDTDVPVSLLYLEVYAGNNKIIDKVDMKFSIPNSSTPIASTSAKYLMSNDGVNAYCTLNHNKVYAYQLGGTPGGLGSRTIVHISENKTLIIPLGDLPLNLRDSDLNIIEYINIPTKTGITKAELDTLITAWKADKNNVDKQNAVINADVSNIADMSYLFAGEQDFNLDISGWNVSNVANMDSMFRFATSFNQDISAWNTSNVTNMNEMFYNASSFNKNISGWNVNNVTTWSGFDRYSALADTSIPAKLLQYSRPPVTRQELNSLIGIWDGYRDDVDKRNAVINANTSEITDMSYLFKGRTGFNLDISGWDTSNVTSMKQMFSGTKRFNQDISSWNIGKVLNMELMFFMAEDFNKPVSNWDTSSVTSMEGTFFRASSFNQPIGNWDVSNVTSMKQMFYNATNFNQNINNWDVYNVTDWYEFRPGCPLIDVNMPSKFR